MTKAIPSSESSSLRSAWLRTAVVRVVLALALSGTLALAVFVALRRDVRHAPLVPSGTTGMLVLDMSASVYEGGFDETVEKLARTDERTGLVVFSDAAYELLPPGSPGRELFPMLRFFKPLPNGNLPINPWENFRAGTRISTGLEAAREALQREKVSRGSILLISDLEVLPDEISRLGEMLGTMRREGIEVRIVPLFPTPEKRALVEQLVGESAFLKEPAEEDEGIRAPEERSLGAAAPWLFVAVAGLLVLFLTVNEGVLSRLEVRR